MLIKFCGLLALLISLFSCSLVPFKPSIFSTQEVTVIQSRFMLDWDFKGIGLSEDEKKSVVYTVYAKKPNTLNWVPVGTSVPGRTSFTVTPFMLSPGRYVFAVTATIHGQESSMHSSEDETADPIGGWHILWIPSE